MTIWPFNRPPPLLRLKSLRRDVDELNVELIEIREDIEKILAAVKRIQGKTDRRKRADMQAVQLEVPPEGGGEPAVQPPSAPDGGNQLHPNYSDPKADLRRRGHILRGR